MAVLPHHAALRGIGHQPRHRLLRLVRAVMEHHVPAPPQQHQRKHPIGSLLSADASGAVLGIDVPQRNTQLLIPEERRAVGTTMAVRRAKQRHEIVRQHLLDQCGGALYGVLPVAPVGMGPELPALQADALLPVDVLQRLSRGAVQTTLQAFAQNEEGRGDFLLAHEISQPVGGAIGGRRTTLEIEQEGPVRHFLAAELVGVVALDLAAGLREQGGHAQQFVEITLVEGIGRRGPLRIEGIIGHFVLGGALAQHRHVINQYTEGRVVSAGFFSECPVLEQARP